MRTIIAPTDFSDISLNAVKYAADIAMDINAELLLMHADEFLVPGSDVLLASTIDYAEDWSAEQLKTLRTEMLARTKNTIRVRTENIKGIVFKEIGEVCEREQPFAVVMATHSPSTAKGSILQSATLYTSKHIQYPVLIVPDKLIYKSFKNIGLACNLKHVYTEPVESLCALVKTFNASLHVLHVKKHDEDEHFAEMMLTRHHLHELNPKVQFVESESIHDGIISFVKKNAIDLLIVMHNQDKSSEKSFFNNLVLHPEIPVMTLQSQLD
jgi:nucleotide-binding universal stress UspA family protein